MGAEEVDQIVSEFEVWWKPPGSNPLFNESGVIHVYNPYTITFEEPNMPDMVRNRIFIYFDIFFRNSQILDAGLKIEYQTNRKIITDLKESLIRLGEDAHSRFLRMFDSECDRGTIPPILRPQYDPGAALIKIEDLLSNESSL